MRVGKTHPCRFPISAAKPLGIFSSFEVSVPFHGSFSSPKVNSDVFDEGIDDFSSNQNLAVKIS